MPLAGRYYIEFSEDGEPGLYLNDSLLGPTYLEYAVAIGTAKSYVVACGNDYYLFPATAATVAEARNSQIGPLTQPACKQEVFQLTGDSLQLKSLNF